MLEIISYVESELSFADDLSSKSFPKDNFDQKVIPKRRPCLDTRDNPRHNVWGKITPIITPNITLERFPKTPKDNLNSGNKFLRQRRWQRRG